MRPKPVVSVRGSWEWHIGYTKRGYPLLFHAVALSVAECRRKFVELLDAGAELESTVLIFRPEDTEAPEVPVPPNYSPPQNYKVQ